MESVETSPFDTDNLSGFELNDFYLLSKYVNLGIFSRNVSEDNSYQVNVVNEGEKSYWALLLLPLPLLAVIGNVLVILSVYREKCLQNVTNYFIVSLAVADLVVGAVVMPLAIYNKVNDIWDLSSLICDFFVALDTICCTASIFNLVAICIDRYIAVTKPIKYSKHNNAMRVRLTITTVWLISAIIGFPIMLGFNTSPERIPELCIFYDVDFVLFSSIGSFYIPCILMIYLYYKLFKVLRARAKKNIKRERNSQFVGSKTIKQQPANLTIEPPTNNVPATTYTHLEPENQVVGTHFLQVVTDRPRSFLQDNLSTYSGNSNHDDELDEDLAGEGDLRPEEEVNRFSATLTNVFITEPVRIEIHIDDNTDSGYRTPPVEHETQPASAKEHDWPNHRQSKIFGHRKRYDITYGNKGSDDSGGIRKSIYKLLRNNSRRRREKALAKKERKAIKTLAVVVGMFLLCWAPFFTCTMLEGIGKKLDVDTLRPDDTMFDVFTWMGYFNSCVNPVIYTIFNLEFRKAFKKLLGDCWWR